MVLLLITGASCSKGQANCTLIGCESMVEFKLPGGVYAVPGPVTVRHCVDGRCDEREYSSGSQISTFVSAEATRERVRVSAEVRDGSDLVARLEDTSLDLTVAQPNGPDCGPKCYQGRVGVPLIKERT